MGALGKYTTYVGGTGLTSQTSAGQAAHALLSTLFPDGPFATQVASGDEVAAQAIVQALATANPGADPNGGGIQPQGGLQQGDLQMFPQGVDLTYGNQAGSGGAPDISKVQWTNPGDPANPYIPDITSPGPGLAQGTDKQTNPNISIADISIVTTLYDPVKQDLRDPSNDAPAISSNNAIGNPQTLGDSGGNV